MLKNKIIKPSWLMLFALAMCVTGCQKTPEIVLFTGKTMGTTYHINVVYNSDMPSIETLQTDIDTLLNTVNEQMSTYRPHSELSQFNQLPIGQSLTVNNDTLTVLKTGVALNKVTDGALDITLGPLVNLWGFGPNGKPVDIPSPEAIKSTKQRIGIDKIHIDGHKVSRENDDVYVDLSSIAKGFGVDKVAAYLDKFDPEGYLVEVGGELKVMGTKPQNKPWRVAIEKPSNYVKVQQVIEPHNIAMATSGDYRNFYEENGQRYSHLIDPRTGYPIKHKLASVTVLSESCMVADGYATAMMVLGTQKSLKLAEQQQLAIMLIEKQDDEFKIYYSSAFESFVNKDRR